MYNSKGRTKRALDLEIGGQIFHIFIRKQDYHLLDGLERSWGDYLSHSKKNGCEVNIIPYSYDRNFFWRSSELDRFRKYFLNIHRRFPSNGQISRSIEGSLRILQHFDPEEESIKYICAYIDEPQALIYSRVGLDLFFFDTKAEIAFFFIQERVGLFTIIKEIMSGISIKKPPIMIGVVNGIMFVLSHLLIYNKGILIHGAAVQKDNRAVLFLGFSGGGKSTITRLCRPDVCFSDDGTIIRKEGDRIYAYHSPFTQVKSKGRYPGQIKGEIEKIFLLEKSNLHKLLPIRKDELMNTILIHLIHFYKYLNDETARSGFYLLKEMLDTLPAYKLEFARKRKIWDDILSIEAEET